MNDSQEEIDEVAVKRHHLASSCDGEGAFVIVHDSASSGCVSCDTVVTAEDAMLTPSIVATLTPSIVVVEDATLTEVVNKQCGDGSAILRSKSNVSSRKKESKPVEKKPCTSKSVTKSSGKSDVVRMKVDPLMTKFKFSLQKYNKALKTATDEQVSLKFMHDKLIKIRKDLIETGNVKGEDLAFVSPYFGEGTQLPHEQEIKIERPKNECSPQSEELNIEKALATKLSELEQKNRELEDLVNKNGAKATTLPYPLVSSDSLLSKHLRAKIKASDARVHEIEADLKNIKIENEDLKKQLSESKTAVGEMQVLHEQAVWKHQQAIYEISELGKEVEKRKEDLLEKSGVWRRHLSKLRDVYDNIHKVDETMKKSVKEVKQDYEENLAECMEATKKLEAINDRYASQKLLTESIYSDFVKLAKSYTKLKTAFEEVMAENVTLKEQVGTQKGKNCQKGTSYQCSRRKSPGVHGKRHVQRQRTVAVQTSEVIKSMTSDVSSPWTDQRGDGEQPAIDMNSCREQMRKYDKEVKALREENANYVEKHKLLIRQLLRLDKQCHLQLTENRRQLKIVEDMKTNSKHLEKEVAVLRNKLAQAEMHKSKGSAKALLSDSSSSNTKSSETGYVASKKCLQHPSTKKKIISATWLKSFWSKENKME